MIEILHLREIMSLHSRMGRKLNKQREKEKNTTGTVYIDGNYSGKLKDR